VFRFVGRALLRLLVHLPVAILGTILTWPVYSIVGPIVRRVTRQPDQTATFRVFGALILFPIAWSLEGWLVTRYVGGCWLGAAVTLSAPFTAYGALLFHDQRAVFWAESRAFLLLRTQRRLAAELKARREEVLRQVEELEVLSEAGGEDYDTG
jgi:hypothetical protein